MTEFDRILLSESIFYESTPIQRGSLHVGSLQSLLGEIVLLLAASAWVVEGLLDREVSRTRICSEKLCGD